MYERVMVLRTDYCSPKERLESQYGVTSVEEWMELEIERVEKNNLSRGKRERRKIIIHKEGSMIALWVDDICGDWETKKRKPRDARTVEELREGEV